VWQYHRCLHVTYGVVWLLLMALAVLVYAEQCTGKGVGISDGDTISGVARGEGRQGALVRRQYPTVAVSELALS
jgi:hypothetical protein